MEQIRIKDLGEIYTGKTPPTADESNFGNDYPFVTPGDLNDSKFISDTERAVSEKGIKHTTIIPSNAICVTCIGSTIGKLGITTSKSCSNQQINTIVPNENYGFDYVYYLLSYNVPYFKELAGVNALPQLNKSDFSKIKLQATKNPKEQTAIAGILSKVDDAINTTKNSIKAVEKLKKSLMQNLLTGKLKTDGTWRTEKEFYADAKMGKVPVGWTIKSINQLFDFYPTSSYSRSKLLEEGKIGYIHYGDIHTKFDRILDLSIQDTPYITDELEKKYEKVKDGDLIISDASEDWDGVGKAIEIINAKSKPTIAGLHTLHLRPKANDLITGIKGYVLNTYSVSISIKRLATGAKVYGVTKSSLKKVLLSIPTENEQIEIKKQLDFFSIQIQESVLKIKTLQRLKKSLMQNLLTGKKQVEVEKINKLLNAM